ncbi:hypothetical protein JHK85_004405 [Glycine max]|nr:hypothetical protein JHK85_004405 [Glycine max]
MHKEILQSPWLCELIALHINLRETKAKPREASALFYGCYLTFNDGKPSLTCELFDSGRVYEDAVHLEELNTLLGRRYDTNYSISKWVRLECYAMWPRKRWMQKFT